MNLKWPLKKYFIIKPKKWWSLSKWKKAKIMQKVVNWAFENDEEFKEFKDIYFKEYFKF